MIPDVERLDCLLEKTESMFFAEPTPIIPTRADVTGINFTATGSQGSHHLIVFLSEGVGLNLPLAPLENREIIKDINHRRI